MNLSLQWRCWWHGRACSSLSACSAVSAMSLFPFLSEANLYQSLSRGMLFYYLLSIFLPLTSLMDSLHILSLKLLSQAAVSYLATVFRDSSSDDQVTTWDTPKAVFPTDTSAACFTTTQVIWNASCFHLQNINKVYCGIYFVPKYPQQVKIKNDPFLDFIT